MIWLPSGYKLFKTFLLSGFLGWKEADQAMSVLVAQGTNVIIQPVTNLLCTLIYETMKSVIFCP